MDTTIVQTNEILIILNLPRHLDTKYTIPTYYIILKNGIVVKCNPALLDMFIHSFIIIHKEPL